MKKPQYPFNEGDNYWIIIPMNPDATYEDNIGFFQRGVTAIQSCWDDQSELFHDERPNKVYYKDIDDVLRRCRDEFDFIKLECFACEYYDMKSGDYFVCEDEDSGKFQKSY